MTSQDQVTEHINSGRSQVSPCCECYNLKLYLPRDCIVKVSSISECHSEAREPCKAKYSLLMLRTVREALTIRDREAHHASATEQAIQSVHKGKAYETLRSKKLSDKYLESHLV